MNMYLKKIVIDQFMGVNHAEYDFAKLTDIHGMNGSGKSTIAIAHTWVWADKDYNLASNPEVHPMNMEESEPTVREIISINGTDVEVCKCQKDARSKKEKEDGKPFRVKNTYEINAVPMTQSNFADEIEERGIEIDKFLLYSHLDYCLSQKTADLRKLLFGMSDSKTDAEIAAMMPECAELAKLLETRKIEEVSAIYKRQKATGKEELDAIPQKIIGMEQSKQEVNVDAITAKSDQLEDEFYAKMSEFEGIVIPDKSSLEEQISNLRYEDEQKTREFLDDAKNKLNDSRYEYRQAEVDLKESEFRLNKLTGITSAAKADLEERLKRYEEAKKEVFQKSSLTCTMCGQALPKDKAADIMSDWTLKHEKELAEMKESGNNLARKITGYDKEVHSAEEEYNKKLKAFHEAEEAYADAQRVYDQSIKSTPKPLNSEKIARLTEQINSIDAIIAQTRDLKAEMDAIKSEIKECERELAKETFNKNIDAQIEEMRVRQKTVAQYIADAEKILYQLTLLSQKKNELLEDSVNKNFPDFVKFKLFEYLKNGEVKDACIPMVFDGGEWKNYNSAANNGLKVLAKIGILRGIQTHFDAHYPVFLDNAECLDSETKKKVADASNMQLIFLSVSDSPTLTFD